MHDPQVPPVETATDGPTRSERIASRILSLALVLLVVSLLGMVIKVPYAVEYPGSMTDTLSAEGEERIVEVKGAKAYPTEGSLYFTTVSVLGGPERHVSMWEWVTGKLHPDAQVVPEQLVYGTQTSDDAVRRMNEADMQGSQKNAIASGIRSTGTEVGQRVVVAEIAEGYPADGRLALEDEIRAVDGKGVERVADVTAAISGREPGEQVEIEVERRGEERTISLATKDLGGDRAGIGVALEPLYDYPFEVRIDAGPVGGPSAGMMFALAVHDVLTPGALTGGTKIAGTGTIDDSGRVGNIGGIEQKMVGAKNGGAEYFLAPAGNCPHVVGEVPDGLQVVKVADLDEAIDAVEAIADGRTADLPSCG